MSHSKPIPPMSPKYVARFWSYVDRTGGPDACWIWKGGSRHLFGYGRCYIERDSFLAHRVSWFLANGQIPGGLLVCHNCPNGDNPACVNPLHLFLGTNDINMADMAEKQRSAIGMRNGTAKLTDELVREIRSAYRAGESLHAIARRMPVDVSVIHAVVHRHSWKHVQDAAAA